MSKEDIITSAVGRLVQVGGLLGRVGVSMAGDAMAGLFSNAQERRDRQLQTLLENAQRALETLGSLKGLPMKLGQMLSLHEGLLPKEAAGILRSLQKEAPPLPYGQIEGVLRSELGERFGLIEAVEPEVFAAASIGQVHRATLVGGRVVVFKIQYPGIDRVVAADLRNLRPLLRMLVAAFSAADFDAIWSELSDRLLEELDYEREAANIERMRGLEAGNASLILPEVLPELSTKRVLCMTCVEGISPAELDGPQITQELRDGWGQTLIGIALRGLFATRFLHADPNLANFAFRMDGRVIMYDLGCMKEVPPNYSRGLAKIVGAVLAGRDESVPALLREIGIGKKGGGELPEKMLSEYMNLFRVPLSESDSYRFGGEHDFYAAVMELGRRWWTQGFDLQFPHDAVFVDRTLNGHLGNLVRLKARGPWRAMVEHYISEHLAVASPVQAKDTELGRAAGETRSGEQQGNQR